MIDPLSVAGLTLAVLDQLWKIGEGTAQLVSNFRGFDSDSSSLVHKIQDENNRTKALRMLLFEASYVSKPQEHCTILGGETSNVSHLADRLYQVYGGLSLFEQFDADVRDEIHVFLEEARDVLGQAYQLLYRRQEGSSKADDTNLALSSKGVSNLSLVSYDSLSPTSPAETSLKRPKSFQKLWWSLRDKKRVEQILRDFTGLNSRIHESIKLWCLGTSIGVNMQHLNRLQTDENSRVLGFDIDARLQFQVSQFDAPANSLQINDLEICDAIGTAQSVGDGSFSILNRSKSSILIEHRSYAPESPVAVELDSRTHDLVDKLASLLHQRKESVFRTPPCQGWVRSTQQNTVAFLFSIPEAVEPSPTSLLSILQSKDIGSPSLGSRFWLAVKLARFVSQLQLVKWVHESFRSENILFFPQKETHDFPERMVPGTKLDLSEPWILGFEFSRPETYFSSGHGDMCLGRDVYRHPDRQKHPSKVFSKVHDIYALGVVLLEIGLWQPALSLEKSGFSKVQDPNDIKKHLLKHAEKRLGNKMGERYKTVVLQCLKGNFEIDGDTKEDLKLQQAFRTQVVEVLQRAAENI